ncbi:MAG: IclR family transcriptional regulator [Planctomycetota bacterium]
MVSGKAGTIARGVAVLRLCARRGDGVSFNELRAACGDLVPSTMARLLRTLVQERLVRKDAASGLYHVGDGLRLLAREVLGRAEHGELLRPVIEALAEETGQSVLYVGCDGAQVERMLKCERPEAVHYGELGERLPILQQGLGWVCLAFYPADERRRLVLAHCQRTGADPEAVQRELDACRRDGVLIRREAHRFYTGGVYRIGAPVFADGVITGALGLMLFGGPAEAERRRLAGAVQAAARRASA